MLIQRPMWAVRVVVLDELLQYHREVALSGDQELVEAFPAERADEAFRDRVRPWCPYRGADDPDVGTGEDGVERGGELCCPGRGIKNRNWLARSPRSIRKLRACWVTQDPVGWAVIPARCTRRRPCSITSRMYRRRRKTVSTWAKSTARIAWACVRRNCDQVGPARRGEGSSPASFKIFRVS